MSQAIKADPDQHLPSDAHINAAPRGIKLDDSVISKLQASGDRERFALLLRKHLDECGWVEAVTAKCRGAAAARPAGDVTVQQLLDEIRPFGRAKVPDQVKAELLRRIRAAIAAP